MALPVKKDKKCCAGLRYPPYRGSPAGVIAGEEKGEISAVGKIGGNVDGGPD